MLIVWPNYPFSNLKIELDKTAEEFRKAHSERQELLRQWENTIEQMQKRDREMDRLAVVSAASPSNYLLFCSVALQRNSGLCDICP